MQSSPCLAQFRVPILNSVQLLFAPALLTHTRHLPEGFVGHNFVNAKKEQTPVYQWLALGTPPYCFERKLNLLYHGMCVYQWYLFMPYYYGSRKFATKIPGTCSYS